MDGEFEKQVQWYVLDETYSVHRGGSKDGRRMGQAVAAASKGWIQAHPDIADSHTAVTAGTAPQSQLQFQAQSPCRHGQRPMASPVYWRTYNACTVI